MIADLARRLYAARRPYPRIRCLAVVAVVLVAAGACGSGSDAAEERKGQTGFVSGSGTLTEFAEDDRLPAPKVEGETLDGGRWQLSDHTGKVVVLNVWGSWCPPCRKEAPDLVAAAKELGPSTVFIGLNTRDLDKAPARKFVKEFGVGFPSLYDPSGKQLLGFRGQISPSSIPSTLVIDTDGRVAARVIGPVTTRTLVGVVERVRG